MKNIILILIFLPTFLYSQGWEKTYGGLDDDEGQSVQQTSDGGYIITGYTYSFGNDNSDIYLIKTDENGEKMWAKTYGGEYDDKGYSVQQTIDGGYIVAGYITVFNDNSEIYLLKTDSNGSKLWNKVFGGQYDDFAYSVQQTTDGGYIITGETKLNGIGGKDIFLIKTDNIGDTIWTKTFAGENSEYGYSVQQTNDGGYITAGKTRTQGMPFSDVYLIKTDNFGDTLWTRKFGGENEDFGRSVKQTNDGGYIIGGGTFSFGNGSYDLYLIKTDSNGIALWAKTIGSLDLEICMSVQQTSDGGYILAGGTRQEGISMPFYVYTARTDSNGDTLWTKVYGGPYHDYGRSVQQTTDGGYIIVGHTGEWGGAIGGDVYLIKTDENGIVSSTSEISISNPSRKIMKMIDISGKEISKPIKNQPYIEIYDNGTTEKKMKIK